MILKKNKLEIAIFLFNSLIIFLRISFKAFKRNFFDIFLYLKRL